MSPANRPSICTVDNQNCVALSGRLHFDVGEYSYSPNSLLTAPQDLNNGVNARRARIGVGGTFMGDWNYLLAFEFGGSSDGLTPVAGASTSFIHDAFLSYTALKPVTFEGGYTTLPITLDWATSSNDIMFMERASSSNIATNIVAGSIGRP
jgi:phosphate-selective porin OprO/OprP